METDDEDNLNRVSMITDHDTNIVARELKESLRSLRACYNLMKQHGNTLQYTISSYQSNSEKNEEEMISYLQALSDRTVLFGISARAMLKASSNYLMSAEADGHRVFRMLQFERDRARELEKMLFDIAKQHTTLERKSRGVSMRAKNSNTDKSVSLNLTDEEENTENAEIEPEIEVDKETEADEINLSESDSLHIIRKSIWMQSRKSRGTKRLTQLDQKSAVAAPVATLRKSAKRRRSRVPDRPNVTINAWSLLKNSIGKDLSKIPMPVNFNEPLSMLQRLTEEMEYAELLDTAATIEDTSKQIAYVAAFSVSAYATTASRTAKPFNPLLCETYECDRMDDRGWRSIAEQVSHHPPISAFHCEGSGWVCWQESSMKIKFKGKNLQIVPAGHTFCKFANGNTYSWNKVTTIVNNIIVGKMWLDQQGEVDVTGLNTAAGVSCKLTYVPFSIFSRETQRRVKGVVVNASNEPTFAVQGYWDSHFEIAPITADTKNLEPDRDSFLTIWTRHKPDAGSEKYHHFSRFTCELNELEENVAPTDSRLRPDLRYMEQGLWDESNVEKLRIEQKQRLRRPANSESEKEARRSHEYVEHHEPLWFNRTLEKGKTVHTYNGNYWGAKERQDWSKCPDIY